MAIANSKKVFVSLTLSLILTSTMGLALEAKPTLPHHSKNVIVRQAHEHAQHKEAIKTASMTGDLTPDTQLLTRAWNIDNKLLDYKQAIQTADRNSADGKLNIILGKQEMNEQILSFHFDMRRAINHVDRQKAGAEAIKATLAEHQDKAIKYNSYGDLIAGGVTGILSGSLSLGEVDFRAPATVDVVEGAGQAALALLALKNMRREHRIETGLPNLLGHIIYNDNSDGFYPESVWTFLNTVTTKNNSGLTRRQALVERWETNGYCLVHGGHRMSKKEREEQLSGKRDGKIKFDIGLIDDRVAMIEDLKAEISSMDNTLAELFEYVRNSK